MAGRSESDYKSLVNRAARRTVKVLTDGKSMDGIMDGIAAVTVQAVAGDQFRPLIETTKTDDGGSITFSFNPIEQTPPDQREAVDRLARRCQGVMHDILSRMGVCTKQDETSHVLSFHRNSLSDSLLFIATMEDPKRKETAAYQLLGVVRGTINLSDDYRATLDAARAKRQSSPPGRDPGYIG